MTLTDYVMRFSEAEVPAVKHTIFDVDRIEAQHNRCIELLEAIHDLHRRKTHVIENIEGFIGTFPESRAKCVNRVDTLNRCITRMEAAYYREVEKLIINSFI